VVLNYELPGLQGGRGFVGNLTEGWAISGTSIYQCGYPFTVVTRAPLSAGGDFNADGDNLDYPDVTSYSQGNSRSDFLNGIFDPSHFTVPTLGTDGNEKTNRFRNPSVAETDLTACKSTRITERLNFQMRFEFFNIFNRPNYFNGGNDLSTSAFGKVQNQRLPRHWQIGAKLTS
jgi:hypothetical protein